MESAPVDYKEKLPYLEMRLYQKKYITIPYLIQEINKCKWLLELTKLSMKEAEAEIAELERQIEERQKGQLK